MFVCNPLRQIETDGDGVKEKDRNRDRERETNRQRLIDRVAWTTGP